MTAWHGSLPGSAVESDTRRSLGSYMVDILGLPAQSKAQLDEQFQRFPGEAEAVVDVLRQMSVRDSTGSSGWMGSRHWKRATQSSRTAAPFTSDTSSRLVSKGLASHTQGFLSYGAAEHGLNALAGRRVLCARLQKCLLVEQYKPLLNWVDDPDAFARTSINAFQLPSTGGAQNLAADSALGTSFYWIDGTLQGLIDHLTLVWREGHAAEERSTTPAAELDRIAEEAYERIKQVLDLAAQHGAKKVATDSLSLRFAAAVSANRGADELWSRCDMELKALQDAETLLGQLIKAKLGQVPEQFQHRPAVDVEEHLATWLTNQFGPAGELVDPENGIRPMTHADIATAVALSGVLQRDYVAKQSVGERGLNAFCQYGGAEVRFVFLIALLASYELKSRVSEEFTGSNNPTKAVFPFKNKPGFAEPGALSLHAAASIERMVALIHRSVGVGWKFDVAALREHAEAKVRRLDYQARLLQYAVDGRPASEIYGIYDFLTKVASGALRSADYKEQGV